MTICLAANLLMAVDEQPHRETNHQFSIYLIGCGGDLNSENGTFTSPNWPNPYPHNRECIWRITVPIGKRIQLNLNNMHLEFQTNCSYDFIEVRSCYNCS